MRPNFSTRFTHDIRAALGVVPMAMRQPELDQPALFGRQNGLYVVPNVAGGID